jgi:hypothetical protein
VITVRNLDRDSSISEMQASTGRAKETQQFCSHDGGTPKDNRREVHRMSQLPRALRFTSRVRLAVLLCLSIGCFAATASARGEDTLKVDQQSLPDGGMHHMSGHKYMTLLMPPNAGDQEKADAVVAAKAAMAPYQDYRKALGVTQE